MIKDARRRFEINADLFFELLESYGSDRMKKQIVIALGTVLHYLDYGRHEESGRLMADVQYKVGGSTFVNQGLRQYFPEAEREDLRLYYEELDESMVRKLCRRTAELLNMPPELIEAFITRMMELSNARRAEFMTRLRRFEVSARGDGCPQIGDIMNISRALEEYIGTRFVPPPWRPYLDFGGSDLEEERFHGPMEVDDSEENVAQQSANENGLAEAYRVDALRRRTVERLRDRAEPARIRGMFEEADGMELQAENLEYL